MISIDLVSYKKNVEPWLKRYVYICELPNGKIRYCDSLKEVDRFRARIEAKYQYVRSDSQFDYYTKVRI